MKRTATLLLLISVVCHITAQFKVTNSGGYVMLTDAQYNLDALIMLNGIDALTTITYTGNGDIEWRYTLNGGNFSSTQKSINPEGGVLYRIYVNSQLQYHIYTLDYSAYPIKLHDMIVVTDDNSVCEQIKLHVECSVPMLSFLDRTESPRTLPRTFTLKWTDTKWQAPEWIDSTATTTATDLSSEITVKAPRCNTTFTLKGDNWASEMGVNSDSVSVDYQAVKVECHLMASVVEREYSNEKDRSSESAIEGSGPLNVEILSHANPLDIVYYEWFVSSVDYPNNYQRYNDANLNYTFRETGEYKVKLQAKNDKCEYTDSINIKVTESYIEAPNVFTPNGDGINDEWRVAYRSIERYSCIIQNRWGRTVFRSDNPGKGWDGNIGGRPASTGTYYYVIIAYGTDKNENGKQKRYKLSGDINLLR
ncbi:MAG: gliding motility-associated C-terminal domain-containing protein [Candidatus Aphodosoma sp.]